MQLFIGYVEASRMFETQRMATWAVAENQSEAGSQLLRVARKEWPEVQGWKAHTASANPFLDPSTLNGLTDVDGNNYLIALAISKVEG